MIWKSTARGDGGFGHTGRSTAYNLRSDPLCE